MEGIALDEDSMVEHVARARIDLGERLLQGSQYEDALHAFVSALELTPDSHKARLGLRLAQQGLDRQSRSACCGWLL
jgi:Tfp pilus assembly protein PilF